MRDYTYYDGARFGVANIFRSQRFNIDRLDLSWVDERVPEFVRGLRIIDFNESETFTLHDKDADNLMYSFAYIFSTSTNEKFLELMDAYLIKATQSKEYLIAEIEKENKEKEEVLH